MIPGGSKERSAQQHGYFEETFKRIMDGESYSDPIRVRRLQRRKAAQLDIGKPFLPSNGDKLMYALLSVNMHTNVSCFCSQCWTFESCSFNRGCFLRLVCVMPPGHLRRIKHCRSHIVLATTAVSFLPLHPSVPPVFSSSSIMPSAVTIFISL